MTPASFKVQRSQSQKLKGVKTEILELSRWCSEGKKNHFSGVVQEAKKKASPHQSGRSPPPKSRKNSVDSQPQGNLPH